MNEQILKNDEAECGDKNEAVRVIDILRGLPEGKRQIAVAIASAYIDGMEAQKILDDKVTV